MEQLIVTKEHLYNTLSDINTWINNADMKASTTLGFIGVVITVALSNENFISGWGRVCNEANDRSQVVDIIYLLFCLISGFMIVYGIWKLIEVLIPTLTNDKTIEKSFRYYGYVGVLDRQEYKKQIAGATEQDFLDDILNQIHINSQICNKKFQDYKQGVLFAFLGIGLNIILYVVGMKVYL